MMRPLLDEKTAQPPSQPMKAEFIMYVLMQNFIMIFLWHIAGIFIFKLIERITASPSPPTRPRTKWPCSWRRRMRPVDQMCFRPTEPPTKSSSGAVWGCWNRSKRISRPSQSRRSGCRQDCTSCASSKTDRRIRRSWLKSEKSEKLKVKSDALRALSCLIVELLNCFDCWLIADCLKTDSWPL